MPEPKPWGWYHILWILIVFSTLFLLYKNKKENNEKQLKIVLGVYSIGTIVLEIIKQIIWTITYDAQTNSFLIDYQWYAFPFQFCTTPMFVCFICLFLNKNKVRTTLLSYIAFYTILGSIATILSPESCFVETIEVNIHTMWLHCGSLIVSIYLLMSGEIKIERKNYINASYVFMFFVIFANFLNIVMYHSPLLNGEEFNMFYISPYFTSSLPIFNTLQQKVPYPIFLSTYFITMQLGAFIIYSISNLIITSSKNHASYFTQISTNLTNK